MASYYNSFTKAQHLNRCAIELIHSILRKSILINAILTQRNIFWQAKTFLSKLIVILVSAVFSFGSRLLTLQTRVL